MKLAIATLLAARRWTPAELATRSGGRVSRSLAYRLAADEWTCLKRSHLDGLCDALDLDDPGPLFELRTPAKKKPHRAPRRR
jgi:DNA-binding Xre family transcriptional regulator